NGAQTEARIDVAGKDGRSRGSRSLVTSSHCSALDDSLALSVALLVDQPPEPEPEAAPTAPVVAPPTITIPPEVVAPREPWHGRFGAGVGATWGALPGLVPNLAIYFELAPRQFLPIRLETELFAPAEASRDSTSGATLRLLRFGLSVCPSIYGRPEHGLFLCVGQMWGTLKVSGHGFDHDAEGRHLTYALTLGAGGKLRLSESISLVGFLRAEVPVLRDAIASGGRDATELFRPAPVGVATQIGIEAAIW
ncbi:MAG TPA: hypothetical protein VEQ59_09075, partial [Polyangiaceae bacterium]|nr:hypothetical protein [Polyangiaceae bacterium]